MSGAYADVSQVARFVWRARVHGDGRITSMLAFTRRGAERRARRRVARINRMYGSQFTVSEE